MDKNSPLISIIIPVYNVEKFLRTCLDSIVNQTYKNIEVICVNDGSPDNSLSILNEYASRDRRVIVINQPNSGASAARNKGIEKASGEWLTFSDADDWWDLDACEKLVSIAHNDNPDVILFSYYREYNNRTIKREHIFDSGHLVFNEKECYALWRRFAGLIKEELRLPENFDTNNALWSKLYRSDLIKDNNELRIPDVKSIGAGEDGLFNLYFFKYVKKAVYMSDCLYHYRKTNDSSITTSYKNDFIKKRFLLFDLYRDYIESNKLENDFYEGLSNRIAVSVIGVGLNELSAIHSTREKIANIRSFLKMDKYQNAIKTLELKHMPMHWRTFFFCCKKKSAISVYCLLIIMNQLKKRI